MKLTRQCTVTKGVIGGAALIRFDGSTARSGAEGPRIVHALSDRRTEALALLNRITREKEHPAPRSMSFAYSALGDNDKAVEWFQRFARENPNFARLGIALPPCQTCDRVRADPRYRAVRKDLGLPN